ncbi:MAG TPA: MFS transporter [Anaerolineae bacterium]|nr:MFS transporter [Anaerolineae bacterium]
MKDKEYQRTINAWCMYDWANSAFATTIMAAVLPTFYSSVAAAGLERHIATAYWGYTSSIALLIAAVLAPTLGALADLLGAKKRFLAVFAILGIFFTSLLVLVSKGDWLLASVLYVLGEIGFSGSIVFYDSLLPHVAKPEDIDYVSSKGYAMGYLGGGILLAVNIAMILFWDKLGLGSAEMASRWSFLSVGIWWAIFTIPVLRYVPEPPTKPVSVDKTGALKATFARLGSTVRDIRRYRELATFIVAFWLYNDGIGTIIKMATIYGTEIGIGHTDLIGALLLTQFVGIPFSLLFGKLPKRIGTKRSIFVALAVYTLISVLGFFMSKAWHFWVLAAMVGLVQGGSQALSRSLFGVMVPKAKTAEFYGFYDISSKFAGVIGPAVFALVGQLTGTSRLSILSLIVFFVAGALILTRVNEAEGIRVAQAEDALA